MLFVIPFVRMPDPWTILLGSISTLLWTTGIYFMLKALQIGQISRVVPVIGTLIPIFLLIKAISTFSVTNSQIEAILLLVLGLICITIFDWKGKIEKSELIFEITAAFFIAISYVVLREAYLAGHDFLSVLSYSKLILIPVGVILVLLPVTRHKIFSIKGDSNESPWKLFNLKTGIIFGIGQLSAGVSEFLITFSVSLAEPALVNSLQGTQYVFLFFVNLVLSRKYPAVFSEDITRKLLIAKFIGIIFIGIGLYILAVG